MMHAVAVAFVGLLATAGATAPAPDTTLRVPGTTLRFGSPLVRFDRAIPRLVVAVSPRAGASPGSVARQMPLRFFGLDGEATLEFEAGVLTRARVTVAKASPHDIDYVEDDLARQGFRRRCDQRDGINRTCEWTARTRVRLTTSSGSLEADLEPIAEPRSTAASPETLTFAAPSPSDPQSGPVVLDSCTAVRPDLARQSGVFGRVVIEASVDTSGRVVAARVLRGVPMLDDAALECARRYRFAPCRRDGRAHPFKVPLPIRFTL